MTNAALKGKSYAGNPHVRFDEGEAASGEPRRGSLLYIIKNLCAIVVSISPVIGFAGEMMQAVDITVPSPSSETHVRITSDDAKWQSVKSAIPDGPVRCAPQIIYADEASVEDGSTRILESGAFGIGQNFLALQKRFTLRSFEGYISILSSALKNTFQRSSFRGTEGKWNELFLVVSQTNLSYSAYRSLVGNGRGRGSLVRCERYFCVGGRGVSVFYERAYKELLESDLRKKSLSPMAMLQKWEETILNVNGNIAFADEGTAEKRVDGSMQTVKSQSAVDVSQGVVKGRTRNRCNIPRHVSVSLVVFITIIVVPLTIGALVRLKYKRILRTVRTHDTHGWWKELHAGSRMSQLAAMSITKAIVEKVSGLPHETRDVDYCLSSDPILKQVVTQKIKREWAIIIRCFAHDNPRRLNIFALLYLWEKMFSPELSHSEIVKIRTRMKRASGLYKVFSHRVFKAVASDVIQAVGYEEAWQDWMIACQVAFSISDRIVGMSISAIPTDFWRTVYRFLHEWDGKFDGDGEVPEIVSHMINWKYFFKEHPELSEPELLRRYGVVVTGERSHQQCDHSKESNLQDGELAFLDAGKDGVVRGMMWKAQHLIVLDEVDCRLYLPKEWNARPEFETISPCDHIVRLAGSADHEWVSVEHLQLSSEHVNDDLGEWVSVSRNLFGRLNLHAHSTKAAGIAELKEIAFGRLDRRDAHYMKYHNADDMVAFAGTIEITGRLHRLFIVIVRRGADSWKFEYVFPAVEGVSVTSLAYRQEEIQLAARIFVPIETCGRVACVICGQKMEDPPAGSSEGKIGVWLKDFFLFDDMQVPKAGIELPCCSSCRDHICTHGVSQAKIESIPQVRDQIDKGASILEVKCGVVAIPLLRTEKSNDSSRNDVGFSRTASTAASPADDRTAVMKKMQQESKRLFEEIRTAEENKLPIENLVKEHIALLGEFRTVFLADAAAKKMATLDRVIGEIKIVGNMKAYAMKIGLPVDGYDEEIFHLRCQIFSPEAVRKLFHDEGVPTKHDDILSRSDAGGHEGLADN